MRRPAVRAVQVLAATGLVVGGALVGGPAVAGSQGTVQDVHVVNLPVDPVQSKVTNSPQVRFSPTANGVQVTNSSSSPVPVNVTSTIYGDTVVLSPAAGATSCSDIDVASGKLLRLDSIQVSVTGSGTPTAWYRNWGEDPPGGGTGFAVDVEIPLRLSNTQFFPWTGKAEPGSDVIGGTEFNGKGLVAHTQMCVRAPAGNSAQGRFMVTGTFLG